VAEKAGKTNNPNGHPFIFRILRIYSVRLAELGEKGEHQWAAEDSRWQVKHEISEY